MVNITKKVYLVILINIILSINLHSKKLYKTESNFLVESSNLSSIIISKNKLKNIFTLDSSYGSHRKGLGFNGLVVGYTNFPIINSIFNDFYMPENLGLSGRLGYKHYKLDFGIPGESNVLEGHLKFLYSIGEENKFYYKYPEIMGHGRHTISIGYNGFLTTDSTSQVVGQIDYTYANDRFINVFNYMNDTIFIYPSDKYRTAAVKFTHYRELKNNLIGFSGGFSIWAGERKFDLEDIWNGGDINIPDEVKRGETVTLYHGKEYATNIVYGAISFNNISLSLGWDSELFKKGIHNSIHYLINDGNLPSVDREDRIFLELKIGLQDLMF